jgi:hypothetical protein
VPFPSQRHPTRSLDHALTSTGSAATARSGATSATGGVTSAGGPSTQDADATQDVDAETALGVATSATDAAVTATTVPATALATGTERGQDSTCGEQLHVLAVDLSKAQCVKHTKPSSNQVGLTGPGTEHLIGSFTDSAIHNHGQKNASWQHTSTTETFIRTT